ncbi:MAG: efflux RND transporter permease subunit, partial [Rickettsia endosymbiont of Ixodes persulcatus]|nr:efflux RND transporter permease subunit [Rickettsia endosymbiont of Ixodes persulcatus]
MTLSPMMCSRLLKPVNKENGNSFLLYVDKQFEKLKTSYQRVLHESLDALSVTAVFSFLVLSSIYFLYASSKSELAPMEDQGIILSQLTAQPNASLSQTQLYSNAVYEIYKSFPETERVFQLDGINGLNTSFIGMGLKAWDKRKRTSNQLQPLVQAKLADISGAIIAAFQLPPLPGARGLPIQFVIKTTDPFTRLNEVNQDFLAKVRASNMFIFTDTDLKVDKLQTEMILDRDKASQFGLTMLEVGNILTSSLSQNYVNYFNFSGRSYQVIPQMNRDQRQNTDQLLNYYINTANGLSIPLASIAKLNSKIVPETLNHFQQLNSATLSAIAMPGIADGDALAALKKLAAANLPEGYDIDFAGPSRQYIQESGGLITTFFFALIIIFLSLAALFESFRDPFIVMISV